MTVVIFVLERRPARTQRATRTCSATAEQRLSRAYSIKWRAPNAAVTGKSAILLPNEHMPICHVDRKRESGLILNVGA